VTINYIFDDFLIGEMIFRYEELHQNHYSNQFLYEIQRSSHPNEILEILDNKAAWMSKHN